MNNYMTATLRSCIFYEDETSSAFGNRNYSILVMSQRALNKTQHNGITAM